MKKRMVSIFLAVIMLLTLLPTVAFAGEPAQFDPCNGKEASGFSAAPVWSDYVFLGWYTARTGGEKVTSGFADDTTYYAHWQVSKTNRNLVLTEGLTIDSEGMKVNGAAFDGAAYGLSFTEAKTDDPATLTMTNAVIDTDVGVDIDSGYMYAALYAESIDLTIALTGDNVVRKGNGNGDVYGICTDCALSVTGDTLTVTAGDSVKEFGYSYGINAISKLTNSGTLTAMAGAAGYGSFGINTDGELTNSGTLTATAGTAGMISYGIQANGGLKNERTGTLTATAGDAGMSVGILTQNDLKNEGTLTATAGDAKSDGSANSNGIVSSAGTLTNSGTLTATAGDAEGSFVQSGGIQVIELTNSGTLTATAGDAEGEGVMYKSCGIYVFNQLTNNSGTLTATADDTDTKSYGIYAGNAVTVNDGAVVSYGEIQSGGNITAENAFVSGYDDAEGMFDAINNPGTTQTLTQAVAGEPIIIAFTPLFAPCNGGTMLVGTKPEGTWIAPEVEWGDYVFAGWYTERTGGTEVTENFEVGTTYYAHWQVSKTNRNLVLTEGLIVNEGGLYVGADEENMVGLTTPADYGLSFTEAKDAAPATLTMTNAVIDTDVGWGDSCDYYAALYTQSIDLTIDLKGENVVRKGGGRGHICGIYASSLLSMTGDTLTVTAGNALEEFDESIGIRVDGELKNSGTLTATAGDAAGKFGTSCGIDDWGKLENSGTLTAAAGDAGTMSYGIKVTGDFLKNNGKITAMAGTAEMVSYGVFASGELTNSGTLTATAGAEGMMSVGIQAASGLKNEETGTLTATAGDAAGEVGQSFGIQSEGNMLTNSGTLTATAGDAGNRSCGISTAVVSVNSGTLTATAGTAAGEFGQSYGIYATQNISVNGGATTSYGDIKADWDSITVIDGAVVSYGNIQSTGGITAAYAFVSGYDMEAVTFESGTTKFLTQKTADEPIIISFVPVFDPCNGEPLMAGADKTAAPAAAPTREGYTFLGWYTAAVGGEKIESGFETGTIYYAHWREDRSCGLTALLAIAVATVITVRSINQAAKLVLGAPMALALAPQVLRTLNRVVFWQRFF